MSAAVFVHNLGCRANQSDGAAIEQELARCGMRRADSWQEAGVLVLNTCTVTAEADAEAQRLIRRWHRERPASRILVTGCYAQRAPKEIAALPGVGWVVGNGRKAEIAALLSQGREHPTRERRPDFLPLASLLPQRAPEPPQVITGEIGADTPIFTAPIPTGADRTRPVVKVQDGCNNRCSFCVIPRVRGVSRSLPLGTVLGEIRALCAQGIHEVVLSGINLGTWGRDLDTRLRLPDLLRAILEQTDLRRLRLSSVEPMDWTPALIALLGEPRLARHAHLPLQSGSDAVLRRMHRRYRPWHYAEVVQRLRAASPDAALGADVMVGFPGETEAEFAASHDFIAGLPLTYLHVFTYSPRPGTRSAQKTADGAWSEVPAGATRARHRALAALSRAKHQAFARSQLGRRLEVLTLQGADADATPALSDNYLRVQIAGAWPPNRLLQVEVGGEREGVLQGTVVKAGC